MLTHVILTSTASDLEPTAFVFGGHKQVVIGRASDCDLRLNDPTLSRRHCLIDTGEEVAWVRDLDSLNGTFVNGQRVGSQSRDEPAGTLVRRPFRELHDGDKLHVGTHTFWVRLVVDDPPGNEAVCPVESELEAMCA